MKKLLVIAALVAFGGLQAGKSRGSGDPRKIKKETLERKAAQAAKASVRQGTFLGSPTKNSYPSSPRRSPLKPRAQEAVDAAVAKALLFDLKK